MSESTSANGAEGNAPAGTSEGTPANGAEGNQNTNTLDSLPAEYAWVAKEVRDARNEAKNLRERVKAAEPAAQRLAELEESSKSEAEKTAERLSKAETDAKTLAEENLRLRVALKHGVPADLMDRLRGKDEDEMTADAEALMARLKPAEEKKEAKPAPDKTQGNGAAGGGDPAQLFGSLFT